MDDNGNVLLENKLKANLVDKDKAIEIFKLAGLNNYCKIENNSFVYKKEDNEFVVQIINNLGIFIEYEDSEDMNDMSPVQKFEYMSNIVNKLGLKLGDDYSCKKVFMLLHKND